MGSHHDRTKLILAGAGILVTGLGCEPAASGTIQPASPDSTLAIAPPAAEPTASATTPEPAAPQPPPTASSLDGPAAAPPAGGKPCIDVRPVIMRCAAGEVLTHEGCPEPAYMQHCAPAGPK